MRFLRFSLLAFVTMVLFAGCGSKSKEERFAATPRSSDRAVANKVAPAEAITATPAAALQSAQRASFAEAPAMEEAPPEADVVAKSEESKPADAKTPVESQIQPERKNYRFQIRPGTLTAGSLNDHQNLEDYRDYLSQAQQSSGGRNLPVFSLGERVMIEVHDAEGNGVPNAQVTVIALQQAQAQNEGALLDTFTRADGKTFFSSGRDAGLKGETFELTVRPPNGEAIRQQVSLSQSPWVVQLPDVERQLPEQLDLALVIDTTQSMADELRYLQVELDNIVTTINRMYPNVEQRYALILYRDHGDEYVVRNAIDFTGSLKDFRAKLAAQSTRGGGDLPEAMHLALENAGKLSWRQGNVARVMFLVADAPPHEPDFKRTLDAVNDLRRKGVAVYPVAGSGPMQTCEFVLRAAAFLTRGQYLFLTDHSGVGNPHATPTAPKYQVEPLNQLMVRMIASELAGKPVLAQDIIAIEDLDRIPPPTFPDEQNQTSAAPPAHPVAVVHPRPQHLHSHTSRRPSMWNATWVRILAAGVLIGAILLLDKRLRT